MNEDHGLFVEVIYLCLQDWLEPDHILPSDNGELLSMTKFMDWRVR